MISLSKSIILSPNDPVARDIRIEVGIIIVRQLFDKAVAVPVVDFPVSDGSGAVEHAPDLMRTVNHMLTFHPCVFGQANDIRTVEVVSFLAVVPFGVILGPEYP